MALNYIWIGLFLIGIVFGVAKLIFYGDTNTLPMMMDSTFKMSTEAFEMTLGLTGTLTFWMGMLKVAEDGGIVQKLAKFLSPVLTKLFPDIPKNHPALGSIFMNYSANMLGLDNAATPVGLKAMQELQSLNPHKDTASNSMIMFLVLNTSGLTIIPVSIMAYRSKYGASDPTDVFMPMLLATMCASMIGLIAVCIRQRINLLNRTMLLAIGGVCVFVAGLFTFLYGLSTSDIQAYSRVMTACVILGVIALFLIAGLKKKINVYSSFIEGAKGGFNVAVSLIPYCVAILAAVGIFRESGALLMLMDGIAYCVDSLGFNSDWVGALPVAIMKPLSGPGARGMMLQCFDAYGVDSFIGHLSSVLQGCTDTTFYILAVYFGSVGIRKYRYAVSCGLLADISGMIAAVVISYVFFAS